MKPETFEVKKGPELKDNEKVIYDILLKEKSMELNTLKEQTELSNKQWDKGIKALGKLELTKVTKTEDTLLVTLNE